MYDKGSDAQKGGKSAVATTLLIYFLALCCLAEWLVNPRAVFFLLFIYSMMFLVSGVILNRVLLIPVFRAGQEFFQMAKVSIPHYKYIFVYL